MKAKMTGVLKSIEEICGIDVGSFSVELTGSYMVCRYCETVNQFEGTRIEVEVVDDKIKVYKFINNKQAHYLLPSWLKDIKVEPVWSDLLIDSKILVRDDEGDSWVCHHFAGYVNGRVHTWVGGTTQWTVSGMMNSFPSEFFNQTVTWNYARLPDNVDPLPDVIRIVQ